MHEVLSDCLKPSRRTVLKSAALGAAAIGISPRMHSSAANEQNSMDADFLQPPDSARPWVYWYFMDGHLTREGMDADLAAMKRAGLGGGIFLEVGIGIDPGPIEFMSEPWQDLVGHAFEEADRLGLQLALAAGPGWCGAGGPWVKPDQSMQYLVASRTDVQGPAAYDAILPQPAPRTPFFGVETLSPELLKSWKEFYRDEFVLAFPTPSGGARIPDVDEKALYTRGSYSSQIPGPFMTRPWVRPFVPDDDAKQARAEGCVASSKVIHLSDRLSPDGRLTWNVPPGSWTILRFGRTLTGQTTRPSPKPGLGLETDKFSTAALDAHFDAYIASLLKKTGAPQHAGRGLVALHFDSWEMGSQNWSPGFQLEFKRRRGYDPLAMLPALTGMYVDSPEVSERFLWDLRQTASELVCENQAVRLRQQARRYNLEFSLEPYDLNPAADLDLGGTADIPMAEFWSRTSDSPHADFSVAEATSIGHTQGRKIIGSESFTASMGERGRQHPASMKVQGDWAFCQGINKLVIHRYQAQPWLDRFPGMTMGTNGGYGVHWERTQTWWDFVPAYHQYLTRCQQMLRRGLFVADILYLNPEGAPSVFFPPRSAFRPGPFADRRGYNFDGCSPEALITRASVKGERIVFPDGMSYRLLVLPRFDTMTPRLLQKIVELVEEGATILGAPPKHSPSLANYPECDAQVRELAAKLWPEGEAIPERRVGKGLVYYDAVPAAGNQSDPLSAAKWIGGSRSAAAPDAGDKLYFSRQFVVEDAEAVETAVVTMTADKRCELFLNGRTILSVNGAQRVRRVDIGSLLRSGLNRIEATVWKNKAASASSGLIGSVVVCWKDGRSKTVSTDHEWDVSVAEQGPQMPATELGPSSMEPWKLDDASIEQGDIYPSYARAAAILDALGVAQDFEADAPLRFIHRTEGSTDFYFIANGEAQPQSAVCRFRAAGRQPEWWNPLTGERRDLAQFSQAGGCTEIPLRLEACESGFVVFRKPLAMPHSPQGTNFPSYETVAALAGPWQVEFDPKWGGPERVTFPRLEDWTQRPEPGIRNYSGKAIYRTTFDCGSMDPGLRAFISLGKVANIASIKVNDRDLGVAWCEPWRVEVPAGVLRPAGNTIEIVVANLWTNRLIADSGLPREKRLTWTTSNPYKPGDKLAESGLLGPVTLQTLPARR